MQANTITLAVDVLDNNTLVDQLFSRHEESPNRSTYVGPTHSLVSRDQLAFLRTLPKRTGPYYGSAKCAVKFTRDVVVSQADGTDTVAPLIVELSFSIPVGTSSATVVEALQRIIAISDRSDVVGPLTSQLSI